MRAEVEGRVLLNSPPALVGGGGSEGELGGEAGSSRDRELQSDAAFGAVVTRVWVPAPRCPANGGLASGPGEAEQVRAPCAEARAAADCGSPELVRGWRTKRAQVPRAFAQILPSPPPPPYVCAGEP